jgi:SAM-dependent methyltransferase
MGLVKRTQDANINLLRRTRDASRAIWIAGFSGAINIVRKKLTVSEVQDSVNPLLGTEPLFRYATCDDLIGLMAKYPQYCREDRDSDKSYAWGLKAMGTLFCADRIVRFKPARVLEVGAGWNCHFDKHFGPDHEYWMIDAGADIAWNKESQEKFERSILERKNTHFVRGLLGNFHSELIDNSFDLVFSISVVEHVPPEQKRDFYKDMLRILRPGGMIAHSIDIADEYLGRAEYEAISHAGFLMPKQPNLKIRVRPSEGNPTLFEDFWTVYHGYLGLHRHDKWENLKKVPCHYPTILVFGQKPMIRNPERKQPR